MSNDKTKNPGPLEICQAVRITLQALGAYSREKDFGLQIGRYLCKQLPKMALLSMAADQACSGASQPLKAAIREISLREAVAVGMCELAWAQAALAAVYGPTPNGKRALENAAKAVAGFADAAGYPENFTAVQDLLGTLAPPPPPAPRLIVETNAAGVPKP
jgi:hypothetical protein